MKQTISIILVVTVVLLSSLSSATEAAPKKFTDVAESYWAKDQIDYLTSKGIINGYPDHRFGVNDSITRAQAATMLIRALDIEVSDQDPGYADVQSDQHWAFREIATLYQLEVFKPEGRYYQPELFVTRAEMADMLVKAFQLTNAKNTSFTDVHKDHWASQSIDILAANNITTGYPDGSFRPEAAVSRVEFAVFMSRVLDEKFRVGAVQTPPVVSPTTDDEMNRIKNFQEKRLARAAYKDGWIYYSKTWGSSAPVSYHDPKAYGLFKEKLDGTLDGTGRVQLAKEEIYSLTVAGDWVYYTTFGDDKYGLVGEGPFHLYRISLDGKNKQQLMELDFPADVAFINENWIYYSPQSSIREAKQDLYKMSTDGKQKIHIGEIDAATGGMYDMQVVGDYIYYDSIYGLQRLKEDGTEHVKYRGTATRGGFIVKGDWIYYSMFEDLIKEKIDGSEIVQLIPGTLKLENNEFVYTGKEEPLYKSSEVFTFNIKGDSVYFIKNKSLHRYNLNTGEMTQLNNVPTHIIMLGDYIFSNPNDYKVEPKLIKIK